MEEIELVKKAQSGDAEAFGSLVKIYYGEIYTIALGISKNSTEADDLVQEAFIRAFVNLAQLKNPERFGAWLRNLTHNLCIDWLRMNSQQFLPIHDLFNDIQLTFPSPEEKLLQDNLDKALVYALSSLSKDDEKIIRLFYIFGFDYSEIMRISGLSYSAATSRLHKAKKKIRAMIDDYVTPTAMASSGGAEYMIVKLGLSYDVLNGIKAVEYAQSTEITQRHFLCGINLDISKEDGIRFIATDGKRMAIAQLPVDRPDTDMSLVIPTEEFVILMESLEKENVSTSIEQIDDTSAVFYIGDTKKLIKLASEKYPDYRAVIPKDYTQSITMDKKEATELLKKAIRPALICQSGWIQKGDKVHVSSSASVYDVWMADRKAAQLGRELISIIVKGSSPEEIGNDILGHLPKEEYQELFDELEKHKRNSMTIEQGQLQVLHSTGDSGFIAKFNSQYMLDALQSMAGDRVTIHYKMEDRIALDTIATQRSILLRDDTQNMHILMPMMI